MNNPKNRLKITATIAGAVGLLAALLLVVVSPASAVMDNPHSSAAACSKCHASAAIWWTDQGATNGICGQCHNGGGNKDAKTHTTSATYNITMPCTSCHNPHYQDQFRTWKTASYFPIGGAAATGTISAVTATTLTRTGTTPAWTVDQWKDMVLIPNISYPQYNYRILNNTNTTITIVSPPETINLTYGKVGASFAVTYGRLIKKAINGRPVRFFQKSGSHSFADGAAVINGVTTYSVCQVCHTRAGQGAHPADRLTQDCTQCHKHAPPDDGGFMPDCGSCHGSPPTVGAIGGPNGLASYDPPTNTMGTGSNNPGKHDKHANSGAGKLGYSCDTCHTNYAMPDTTNKAIDIGFSIFGNAGGSYDGQLNVKYAGKNGTVVVSPGSGASTCTNIYCHSTVQSGADGTGAPAYKTPQWLDTATVKCGDCHNDNTNVAGAQHTGVLMDSGSHTPHLGLGGVTCDTCHAGNTHVDRKIDVTTGTYSQAPNTPGNGYGTCSTAICHTNVQADGGGAGSTATTPTWGTATACGACHKGRKTDATTMDTGRHTKHLSYSQIDCANCHNGVGDGTAFHPDDNIDVVFNAASGSGSYSQVPNTPGNGYGTCSATYCHSQGQSTTSPYGGGPNTVPGWATASLTCEGCHGYDAAATNKMASGSHTAHVNDGTVMTNKSCDTCHVTTTSNGTSITDTALHVNQAKNVGIAGAYDSNATPSDNFAANACNNVTCHSNANPMLRGAETDRNTYRTIAWGGGPTSCTSCHLGADTGANMTTAGDRLSTTHARHTATDAYGLAGRGADKIICNTCHSATVAADGTTITAANHVNGAKNIAFNSWADPAGVNAGNYTQPNCTNTYCHSPGTSVSTGADPSHAAVAWNATSMACDSCHTGGTATGPSYAGGSPKANSHNMHVVTKGYVCVDCHSSTVDSSNVITDYTKHLNKSYDVSGANITAYTFVADGGTCSTSCHASSAPKWGTVSTGCNFCHSAQPNTGAHAKHVASAAAAYGSTTVSSTAGAYDFGCGNCHPKATSNHMNGSVDIVLNDGVVGDTLKVKNSGAAGKSGSGATTVCSGVYCHSNGMASPTYTATPQWGALFSDPVVSGGLNKDACRSCHGNYPNDTGEAAGSPAHTAHAVGIHYDNIFTGTTGLAPSTTAEPVGTRAHGNAATSTTINCNICHSGTVAKVRNKMSSKCTSCHSGDAAADAIASADLTKTLHVNGAPDVAFAAIQVISKAQVRSDISTVTELNNSWTRTGGYKASGAYDLAKNALDTATMWTGGTKTCSNIACHNSNAVTWLSAVTCTSCHTALP